MLGYASPFIAYSSTAESKPLLLKILLLIFGNRWKNVLIFRLHKSHTDDIGLRPIYKIQYRIT